MSTDNKQHDSTQQTTAGGIIEAGKETLHAAVNAAQQVAHTVGEKLGIVAVTAEQEKKDADDAAALVHAKDLEAAKSHLKHAETQDKSKPVIDSTVHIKENHHKDLLQEVTQPHELKHAETQDKSAPVIAKDIHIKEAPQKQVFAEITKPHDLKHVETDDKSKPAIPHEVKKD